MSKNRFKRVKKQPDIEIIILEDGKETIRYKPRGFVSCGTLSDPIKDKKIEARAVSFGTEPDILFAFHLLAEELVSKLGKFRVLLVLQAIFAKSVESFKAEMELREHAENTKGEDKVVN